MSEAKQAQATAAANTSTSTSASVSTTATTASTTATSSLPPATQFKTFRPNSPSVSSHQTAQHQGHTQQVHAVIDVPFGSKPPLGHRVQGHARHQSGTWQPPTWPAEEPRKGSAPRVSQQFAPQSSPLSQSAHAVPTNQQPPSIKLLQPADSKASIEGLVLPPIVQDKSVGHVFLLLSQLYTFDCPNAQRGLLLQIIVDGEITGTSLQHSQRHLFQGVQSTAVAVC